MNKLEELRKLFKEKIERLKAIRALKTEALTSKIRAERDALLAETEQLNEDIKAERKMIETEDRLNDNTDPNPGTGSLTEGDGYSSDGGNARGYKVRSARDKKDFRSLFGKQTQNNYRWEDQDQDFFRSVFAGRFHPGLTTRSMNIGIASDGGFLIPVETAEQIHNVSLENEIVMPHAMVCPMETNDKKLPGLNIGNHSNNLFGGFEASYKAEAGTLDEKNPKARLINLACKKLTGFLRLSRELFDDLPGGGQQIANICGKGLSWYRDRAFLKGSGAGEPLGILNSPCLLSVAKETGQNDSTIIYENLIKMMSRMFAGSFKNSVWVAHQTCIPQLLTLSIAIGTGGTHIPVMTKNKNGQFEILTRPVIFTEKTEPLGTKGDILLADFSQYAIGLREEMRLDFSPHVYFTTDELAARLIERHDGMPLWGEALTLEDGSTTVSPFVTLADR